MRRFLVGGAVRDECLGLAVKDRDWVVVGATPQQLLALGYRQVGADFPVFLHPKTHEEHALARTERKSGRGYRGFDVSFSPEVTLEEDLQRRDLTINAIAQDDRGELIDPYGGLLDLQQTTLRHVSPAFREDPVRVLRVARFAARFHHLGFKVADSTRALMQQMVADGELNYLVPERIWQEMAKALAEPSPWIFFEVLRSCQALKPVFPELDALFGVPQPERWHPEIDTGVHSLKSLAIASQLSNKLSVRFAALTHDLGKALTDPEKWPSHHGHEGLGANLIKRLARLKTWPNQVAVLAEQVARYHLNCHHVSQLNPKTLVAMLNKLGAFRDATVLDDFLLACEADARGRTGLEDKPYSQAAVLKRCLAACEQVAPAALIAEGYQGAQLGQAIHKRRIQQVAEVLKNYGVA